MYFPDRLKIGDEIRVIAPSRNINILSQETIDIAKKRLNNLGFKVTFGKNVSKTDNFMSSSIEDRVNDIHDAFSDRNVKAIMTAIGGYNSNELLNFIDYNLIKKNPKIFCGFSDITVLLNSISSKSGLVTYLGPHFSSFGMENGFDYTQEYFLKSLSQKEPFEIESSELYSDDLWFLDQKNRKFLKSPNFSSLNNGHAEGELVGGNIASFSLLFGTEYMPDLQGKIILLEAHSETKIQHFDRLLQSLIQQKGFNLVKGILIGLPQIDCNITQIDLLKLIKRKKELSTIPIISNLNFGHTTPNLTLPIGGVVNITASEICNVSVIRV